jgi:hypothetical protein
MVTQKGISYELPLPSVHKKRKHTVYVDKIESKTWALGTGVARTLRKTHPSLRVREVVGSIPTVSIVLLS